MCHFGTPCLVLPRQLHPFSAVSHELPFTAEAPVPPIKALPQNIVSDLPVHVLAVAISTSPANCSLEPADLSVLSVTQLLPLCAFPLLVWELQSRVLAQVSVIHCVPLRSGARWC